MGQWTSGGRYAASKPCRAKRRDTLQGDTLTLCKGHFDTLQKGHFDTFNFDILQGDTFLLRFAGAVAAANPGLLKTLNQMETDEERMLFVSQLHKVDFVK